MTVHLLGGVSLRVFAAFLAFSAAFGQESTGGNPFDTTQNDRMRRRTEWLHNGRTAPRGQSEATLRLRAHRQKMAWREQRASETSQGAPQTSGWTSLGPAPLVSDSNQFGFVSGRATAVAVDPSDPSGDTIYAGGAYGGVWKSTNAANADPASVVWTPVTDQQASLATGAISVNSDGSVVLVGTGEPDNALDSYYGVGILRSTNKGGTWSLISTAAGASGSLSLTGLGFARFAWSSAFPGTVVAASATAAVGFDDGAITSDTERGLYVSADSGVSWTFQVPQDSGIAISPISASATDVVYNAFAGKFFAAIRSHGVYSSTDGTNWTRLVAQPNPLVLSMSNCPAMIPMSGSACPMFRGQFAVVNASPPRNEMYFWFTDINLQDQGIWQSLDGGSSWRQVQPAGQCTLDADAGNPPCGMMQSFYNLGLAAVPNGSATDLYAGLVNLYKCRIQNGSRACSTIDANLPNSWINLTQAYTCPSIASVHPDQHGMDFAVVSGKAILYFANDGGIYRALDGFLGLNSGTCGNQNQFSDLNGTIGSTTQLVSFSNHPNDQKTVLGGTQGNGSAATSAATSNSQWITINGGDGGYSIINPGNTNQWFTEHFGPGIYVCNLGILCTTAEFDEEVSQTTLGGDIGAFYQPYILDPQNANTLLAGTCRVWRGPSDGGSYVPLSGNFDGSFGPCLGYPANQNDLVRSLAAGGPVVSGSSNVVWATTEGTGPNEGAGGGHVFVTTNAAAAPMSDVTGSVNPQRYTISSVAIDPSDTSGLTAYVGIMGFGIAHVFKTTNAGASWTNWTGSGLPDAPVNSLLVDGAFHLIYAGTDIGAFVSSTTAANWTEVGPRAQPGSSGYLPNVPVSAIRIFNAGGVRKLRASTYGRGLWEFDLGATPDYQIVMSNTPQTVFPTQTAVFNGTATAVNGYASGVNLSCAAGATSPPATCAPGPAQVVPAESGTAFTVTTAGIAGDYNFNVHGVGTDNAGITHDAPVTLHVIDFGVSAPSPNSLTVPQGGVSSGSNIQVTSAGSFSGVVVLSCSSGLPSGATCNFAPSSNVSPTASNPAIVSLTVSASPATPVGTFTVTLQAMTSGAPAPKTQTFSLTVTAPVPDFTISVSAAPSSQLANQTSTWNGTLTGVNGYNKTVTLSCIAGTTPPPSTCLLQPNTLKPTGNFTVKVGSATTGTFNFNVQASDGTITHSQAVVLTVNSDVAVPSALNDAVADPGQTASTWMQISPIGGTAFSGTVTYICSGLPAGLACTFNPTQIAAGGASTKVVVNIATSGPFVGTERNVHQRKGDPSIPLSLPLSAIALTGIAVRRAPRGWLISAMLTLLVLLGILVGCGGGGGTGGGEQIQPPAQIVVTVSPGRVDLYPNLPGAPLDRVTQPFSALVSDTGNESVTWSVVGGDANGTIDANGLYTAPAAVPNPSLVTVTATAHADTTKSGTAKVNILTPTSRGTWLITVTVTEATQPVAQHTTTFNLTVN